MKYYLKKGMFWVLKDEEIFFYYTNPYLHTGIKSTDNVKLFNLLKALKEPISIEELNNLSLFDNNEDLESALAYLLSKGYIVKTDKRNKKVDKRLRSYVDSIPHVSFDQYKDKIENTNVCILGVGTAGSYIPEALFKLGINNLVLIDPDKVEINNLRAQSYSEQDVGDFKVQALKKRYQYSQNLKITTHSKFILDYNDLKNTINLEELDYLLICADDTNLTIDILENIFIDYPFIKVTLSGYACFQQHNILLTSKSYKHILKEIKESLLLSNFDDSIIENSGVIFNALFSSLSTAKLIFDNILNTSNSSISRADFLKNTYFIGNRIQYNEFMDYENSRVNNHFYNFSNFTTKEKVIDWIKELNIDNLRENNMKVKTPIRVEENSYIITKNPDRNSFNEMMNIKNRLKMPNHDSKISKECLLIFLFDFMDEFFEQSIVQKTKDLFNNDLINFDNTIFVSKSPMTISSGKDVYINNIIYDGYTTEGLNSLIHETFHALLYFTGEKNIYNHENFVLKTHILFLQYYFEEESIIPLRKSFIFGNVHDYITSYLACEYEKYTYLGSIDSFYNHWSDVDSKELLDILKFKINKKEPFFSYRYVKAMNQNMFLFKELVNKDHDNALSEKELAMFN